MWNFEPFFKNTALISDKGQRLTYEQLYIETVNLADKIDGRCLVFSMCTNTVGSVLGYVSFMQNNIVPVLLNAQLEIELIKNLLDHYKPAYIWMPEELKAEYQEYQTYQEIYNSFGYVLLQTKYEKRYPLFDELALLLTTSGSTGSSKFVRQSYRNVLVNAQQIAKYLKLDESEKPVTTLPMNYTYGCSIINSHLLVGATLLLTDHSLTTREFWTFMKEEGATSFGGVPYTYEMLDKLRFFRMDLPYLRTMPQAGGKLSPELHKKFAEYAEENNKQFVVMYGACEATARMGYLPYDKSLEKYGSCGIAIPDGKFYLLDHENKVIKKPYVTGELIYEGENVTLGYAQCGEDLALGDEWNGKLRTGDMAQCDEDGYYYIVGRKKRFLKVYGNRVNLDELDRLIKAAFDFVDCASTGEDDHVYIFVTIQEIVEKVRCFVAQKTGLNIQAFQVLFIENIPKNDSGKIQYSELKKYYNNTN